MTSELTQAALEPCPFCGGKAEWKDDPKICGVPFGLVVDHKPDCFFAMPMSEEAMLAAWNTRLTAQSGEGRSGAGEDLGDLEWTEDGYSLRTKYDGDVDGDGRHVVVGGDLIVTFDDSEIADEYRERVIAALNARQSGEGERAQ